MLQCQRNTICGLAISEDLQELLTAQPDFCDILSECQVRENCCIPLWGGTSCMSASQPDCCDIPSECQVRDCEETDEFALFRTALSVFMIRNL